MGVGVPTEPCSVCSNRVLEDTYRHDYDLEAKIMELAQRASLGEYITSSEILALLNN